ncbi:MULTISPECIES: orotidine-5'-phosphate decarboxylase [unclassified Pyramidobacter]|uniref:orotidine-5'-phosphate decarboxylase n=1 Tax=unclassified Pyramidobacter TaxID=2632171 RepID=UPI0025F77EB0|nr:MULTISPECIES: orotidine-5'-phosphate decarboxylase [unclassified Pyramidobacter]MCI7402865.1 orotidine-5'-phosphate decarboxylase [Pyramidobacter sp.]MDY3212779.1 orotidine-5'-phosphate decarboxylase [Pyramidobacter sp.]WOL40577.1 orotidine-5'-phosphate decarboxylase [Pyramidobacter sp. YE332]
MTEHTSLPLFAALDLDTLREARRTMDALSGIVDAIKIGPRLYAQGGAPFLKEIVDHGFKLFLDLKLHDIPNTVRLAVETLADLGIFCLTLQAAGGRRMMEESVAARDRLGSTMKLLGITVLTSFDEKSWDEVAPGCPMDVAIKKRAWLCGDCGMDGLVCSPLDLPEVRAVTPPTLLKVVPGVRLVAGGDDQSRVATPADAFRNGADYIVMGRPIYKAPDVRKAVEEIARSIEEGLACRK